jgi:hypothetical protein
MKKKYAEYSKFWLGEDFSKEKLDVDTTYGLIKLSEYRRAVSNFVYILTGKNIPVRFAEKSTSMTDGKVVYIGGEISKGEFDPTVGIALHEAAHIVKSDFSLIKTLWGKVPNNLVKSANGLMNHNDIGELCKYILNVVEDRYIDAWAYQIAPGYRGYYHALYDRYFNLPEIGQAIQSDNYRTPTLSNYKFHFTNLVNKNYDPDALPGLRKITEMLDVKNILRNELSTAASRRDLSMEIVEEIIKNVIDGHNNSNSSQKNSTKSEDGDDSSSDFLGGTEDSVDSIPDSDDSGDGDDANGEDDSDDADNTGDGDKEDTDNEKSDKPAKAEKKVLTEKKMAAIEKIIKKQESFINRTAAVSPFKSKVISKLNTLEKSGVNIEVVGGEDGIPPVECIVVTNLTKELMNSNEFPYTNGYTSLQENMMGTRGVRSGIAIGTMLGRRLQIRNEVKTTKFTRQDSGRIDKRLIASIGYQNENLFYQTSVDKYKNVHLHISVDASSSMSSKWENTISTLVAIAKAASMINNVSVSISFRSGVRLSTRQSELPYVVIAYDSRKDNFTKITSLFPLLFPSGSTPEGLAFQAILEHIPQSTYESDSYFVNISDGEPAFNIGNIVYVDTIASNHTRKQVRKMMEKGTEVISYYVEADKYNTDNNVKNFKSMYGKDSHFIDVKNVVQIAHTLNKKFLSKATA